MKRTAKPGRYRIKSVAAQTGVSTATLRAWERRYGLVQPTRSEGGYRLYSDDDVRMITRVRELIDQGYKVGEAIASLHVPNGSVSRHIWTAERVDDLRDRLGGALLALDVAAAERLARRTSTLPIGRRLSEVYLPLLSSIGDAWEHGLASVAQEHFASAQIRAWMLEILRTVDGTGRSGRPVVLAGAPGEQHEFGLLALAVLVAERQLPFLYLGADLPLTELRRVLAEREAAAVCSSLVKRRSAEECLTFGSALRAATPVGVPVVVGGRGIPASLWGEPEPGLHFSDDFEDVFGRVEAD
jgi:MerR family transcriptional regulator, light-induced transcriptional regulator